MFEHHKKTIKNLQTKFQSHTEHIAFIVIGSVARGDAGEGSDIDYYVVTDDTTFQELFKLNKLSHNANECCVPPCTEANGLFISKAVLKKIRDYGNEISRWSFYKAQIIFTRDKEIGELVNNIPHYPEKDRKTKLESYLSQMYYHFSFFEFAYLSQTKYLIYETAIKLIYSIGRLILADNRMLYPGRKWFFRELQKAPDRPAGISEAMVAFLDTPTIDSGKQIIHTIQNYKDYPIPQEGINERIIKDSVFNWYTKALNIEDW